MHPSTTIVQTHDFFSNELPIDNFVLNDLREIIPSNRFLKMVEVCLNVSIKTLESQYENYFKLDITPHFLFITSSVPNHYIADDRCMGLFRKYLNKSNNE